MEKKLNVTRDWRRKAIDRRDKGEPMPEITRSYNVSHSMILRLGGGL